VIRSFCSVLLIILLVGCQTPGLQDDPTGIELVVLGIAQDGGVPHLGCQKMCCIEARSKNLRLGPASLAVVDYRSENVFLIEATPAVEEQLSILREITGISNEGRNPVDGILLTHAHIGHYAGLIHFGREVASTDGIEVFCTSRMAKFLRTNGPWSQLVDLGQIFPFEVTLGVAADLAPGIRATAIKVSHRDEFSDTVAWRIEGPKKTVLFCPDIDRWDGGVLEKLIEGVDVCYLDATFYDGREIPGRDLSEIPHPPMVVTMELLRDLAKENPGRFRFIHLNHTNPALFNEEIRRDLEDRGFRVAEVGERLAL